MHTVLSVAAALEPAFGISFGSAVTDSPLRGIRIRVPLSSRVTVHDTTGLDVR